MKATLLMQTNPVTKEKNIFFLTDPDIKIEDCLLTSGSWQDAIVQKAIVHIYSDSNIIEDLSNKEFRSMTNPDGDNSNFSVTQEEQEYFIEQLESLARGV